MHKETKTRQAKRRQAMSSEVSLLTFNVMGVDDDGK